MHDTTIVTRSNINLNPVFTKKMLRKLVTLIFCSFLIDSF